jgi:hypothetical protein
MGGKIEINDTLQITCEQGFPEELDLKTHLKTPYSTDQFKDKIFSFRDKPALRVFESPPVRVFLVENLDGKWIYWGLIHIVRIDHDYVNKTTSGKFKIIYIYTPEEMKQAHSLIDRVPETDYFGGK